jgi:hypothetical protein
MSFAMLSRSVNRRQFTLGASAGAAILALGPARSLLAAAHQDAAGLASLGYPELKVTVTDSGFEGVPAETAAGRYLLTVEARTTQGPGTGAFFGPPAGMTAEEFLGAIAGPPPGADGGTPPAGAEGGDQGGGEMQLPLFVYQAKFAGGAQAMPGQTAQAVIDLTPGEWMVWADDPSAPQPPAMVKVTDDFPAEVQDPAADLTATLVDFKIIIDGALTAGKHILAVPHHGAQPHFLALMKGPDSMTKDQVMAALMAPPDATPEAGGLSENDLQPTLYTPLQSIGTVTYHEVELEPGTYMAACFFPTAGTGAPHAMEGMVEVIKVS